MFNENTGLYDNLSKVQKKIKSFSKKGLNIAKSNNKLLKNVVENAVFLLDAKIEEIKKENFNTADTYQQLCNQLIDIKNNLEELPTKVEQDIKKLSKDIFTITLFGRTMAGKSTLKEILTKGDGSSIGKGSQRTTRDVREYYYKNLRVFDVPGIAAFEGKEDETLAFETTKKADLILFLITDDAPQSAEAECMAKIVSLGKPVICIINVKIAIDKNALDLFYDELKDRLEEKRNLNDLKKTFLSNAKQYGQDWNKITFVCTHLKSAFLSQQKEFYKDRIKLYETSRFAELETIIIKEIVNKGTFYKFKNFADSVIVPITKAFDSLFKYSIQNSNQGTILAQKHQNFKKKIEELKEIGKNKIDSFIKQLKSELENEIPDFVEKNYDNNKATEEWKIIEQNKEINNKANDILKELEDKCKYELEEISRTIKKELNFDSIDNNYDNLNMNTVKNFKKIACWGSIIVGGAIMLSPLGWVPSVIASFAVCLIPSLFDDKEKKARRNRIKLEQKIKKHIDKKIRTIDKKMKNHFYNELIKKNMYFTSNLLYNIIGSIYELSNIQQNLATELNKKLKETNKILILEALKFLQCEKSIDKIKILARTPGQALMFVLEDKEVFPERVKFKLSNLLNEKIWFVFDNNNIIFMLKQCLGKNRDGNRIDFKLKKNLPIAKIITENLDDNVKIRIPLTQQLTEFLIITK